ncbi:hypothetical protein RA27_22725 [Ruegeria sp. ANG-R]|uniref:hypothetical protein n=1 Tax=Ruegeria sp. ANG-R TaxID=1577903 RepID=UPI00058040C6|nr:hypothetical protein [Ruegeria sp. ANG-R]KIC35654.1 hypothetical protein RA27_22725 [Ruegeria sp. ANG-R]
MKLSFRYVVAFAPAVFLSACLNTTTERPATARFDGTAIEQPINILANAYIKGNRHTKIDHNKIGAAAKCSYQVGNTRGRLTTPATINVPITDQPQTLQLECEFGEAPQTVTTNFGKTFSFPAYTVKGGGSAQSTWNRRSTTKEIGSFPLSYRIPENQQWTDSAALSAVDDHGARTFPGIIVVNLNGQF